MIRFCKIGEIKSKFIWTAIILIVFFVLALILTFPLLLDFSHSVPATLGEDTRFFIWNLWQFRHTIFDLGENPFAWSRLLYYPVGFSQAATAYDNLYNTVLSVPLYFLFRNDVVVYNLLLLLNIALAGLGMNFLVTRHFTSNRSIAFLIAFAYAFSPYAFHRLLGHINLATVQWIPFFLLYFISLLKRPTIKNGLASGVFLFLIGISSWHYLVYIALAIIFLIIYKIFLERDKSIEWKKYIGNFLVFFTTAAILIIPVLWPFLKSYARGEVSLPGPEEHITFAADPLSYLTPSPLYLFFGKGIIPREIYIHFSGNIIESTTYLGIGEITLLIFFISCRKELKQKGEWKKYKKWIWFSIVFFILSLGPHPKIIQHALEIIPLPMAIFSRLPFFSLARDSVRLSLFVFIGVLMILSILLDYLSQKMSKRRFQFLIIGIFAIFFAERIAIPIPIRKLNSYPFYNYLRQDQRQYAIIQIPISGHIDQEYNFGQTIHQKFIVKGVVQHTAYNNQTSSFIQNDPFLRELFCWYPQQDYSPSEFISPSREELRKKYLQNDFKYILIHKDFLDYPICQRTKEIVQRYLSDVPRIYKDKNLEVIATEDL